MKIIYFSFLIFGVANLISPFDLWSKLFVSGILVLCIGVIQLYKEEWF